MPEYLIAGVLFLMWAWMVLRMDPTDGRFDGGYE